MVNLDDYIGQEVAFWPYGAGVWHDHPAAQPTGIPVRLLMVTSEGSAFYSRTYLIASPEFYSGTRTAADTQLSILESMDDEH